jgi:hypothetical protein
MPTAIVGLHLGLGAVVAIAVVMPNVRGLTIAAAGLLALAAGWLTRRLDPGAPVQVPPPGATKPPPIATPPNGPQPDGPPPDGPPPGTTSPPPGAEYPPPSAPPPSGATTPPPSGKAPPDV